MSVHYIFVHGWGTDPDFWERVRPHFPEKQVHFLNLGFIGSDQRIENHKAPSSSKRVYITHSLGTLSAATGYSGMVIFFPQSWRDVLHITLKPEKRMRIFYCFPGGIITPLSMNSQGFYDKIHLKTERLVSIFLIVLQPHQPRSFYQARF